MSKSIYNGSYEYSYIDNLRSLHMRLLDHIFDKFITTAKHQEKSYSLDEILAETSNVKKYYEYNFNEKVYIADVVTINGNDHDWINITMYNDLIINNSNYYINERAYDLKTIDETFKDNYYHMSNEFNIHQLNNNYFTNNNQCNEINKNLHFKLYPRIDFGDNIKNNIPYIILSYAYGLPFEQRSVHPDAWRDQYQHEQIMRNYEKMHIYKGFYK